MARKKIMGSIIFVCILHVSIHFLFFKTIKLSSETLIGLITKHRIFGSRKKAHWKKSHRKQALRKKVHAEKSARGKNALRKKRSRKKAQTQLY